MSKIPPRLAAPLRRAVCAKQHDPEKWNRLSERTMLA
jgi:hypothetical protein